MPRRDEDDEDFDRDDDVDVKRKKRKGGNSDAAGRLVAPAITLIVAGAISAVGWCIGVPVNIYQATQPPPPIAAPGDFAAQFQGNPIGGAITGVILTLVSGFVIFGGIQMKDGKMYGVSLAAAILAVIPCCSPCVCLGIPVGIWALIVLMDADVKSAFTS